MSTFNHVVDHSSGLWDQSQRSVDDDDDYYHTDSDYNYVVPDSVVYDSENDLVPTEVDADSIESDSEDESASDGEEDVDANDSADEQEGGTGPRGAKPPVPSVNIHSQAEYDVELEQSPTMSSIGLAYHLPLRLFICLPCKTGVRFTNIPLHFSREHPKLKPLTRSELLAIRLAYPPHQGNHPELPIFSNGEPIIRIRGLAVESGYACSLCRFASPKHRTMQNHFYHAHRGVAPSAFISAVAIQLLYPYGQRAYFQVQEGATAVIEGSAFALFKRSLLAMDPVVPVPATTTDLSPLLRALAWPTHIQGHDPVQLVALVCPPRLASEPHLIYLGELVEAYLQHVQVAIGTSPNMFVLTHINSDSPVNASRTPFRPLQSSLSTYAALFTRLFCMILRWVDGKTANLEMIISDEQEQLAKELLLILRDGHLLRQQNSFTAFNRCFHQLAYVLLSGVHADAITRPHMYPVIRFLTLIHLHNDGTFAPAQRMTGHFAKIQWAFRAVVFRQVEAYLQESALTPDSDLETGIKAICENLHEGRLSPYSVVLSIKHLVNSFGYKHRPLPGVYWQDKRSDTLIVQGARLSIASIRTMVASAEQALSRYLFDNLLLGVLESEVPTRNPVGQDVEDLYDDLPKVDAGYSFIEDPRNPFVKHKWAIMHHILSGPLCGEFTVDVSGAEIVWNPDRVQHFLLACASFVDDLAPLLHLTSGGPARNTELVGVRTHNTSLALRNVYHVLGRVTIITRYHKGSNQTGFDKVIPRYLPSSLSRLLLIFLAYVRPLEVYFQNVVGSATKAAVTSASLFVNNGRLWHERDLTVRLQNLFLTYTGVSVNSRTWRQAYEAIATKHRIRQIVDSTAVDVVHHAQSAHSTRTAEAHYGVDASALRDMSDSTLLLFREASIDWQDLLGYGATQPKPDTSPEASMLARVTLAIEAAVKPLQDQILSLERSLASSLKRPRSPSPESRIIRTAPFTPDSVATAVGPSTRSSTEVAVPILPRLVESTKITLSSTLAPALQLLHGEGASFRSLWQSEACQLVLNSSSNLLLVAPTSAGKTMAWLMPTAGGLEPSKTTVVIVPLRALMKDFLRRSTFRGFSPEEWSRSTGMTRSLVFAPVEAIQNAEFRMWLANLGTRLARVVFEEAHLALVTYRPVMDDLVLFRRYDCPFVLVTATAPPSLRLQLLDRFAVSQATIHAAKTHRPEISYSVEKAGLFPAEFETRVKPAVAALQSRLSRHGQILIFCRTKDWCDTLAGVLGCKAFHNDLDAQVREANLAEFKDQRAFVLTCTAALSAGVDFEHVEAVIHVGTPGSFVDFSQESGRAGRRQQRSFSVVFPTGFPNVGTDDSLGLRPFRKWLQEHTSCRRAGLSQFMDGEAVTCASLMEAHLCDVCARVGAAVASVPAPRKTTPLPDALPAVTNTSRPPMPTVTPVMPLPPVRTPALPSSTGLRLAPVGPARSPFMVTPFRRPPTVDNPISHTTIGSVSMESERARTLQAEKELTLGVLRKYLPLTKSTCTYCLAQGELTDDHLVLRCQHRPSYEWLSLKRSWKQKLQFPPAMLCYRCMLPQRDADFHGAEPYEKAFSKCLYDDVLPEILYGLYTGEGKAQAEANFDCVWADENAFGKWVVGRKDKLGAANCWLASAWLLESVCRPNEE